MASQGVRAYSQIHATTRALYSTMLTPATWDALIQAPDSDTVLTTLAKTVYGPHLQIDRQLLTPRRIVYQIKWHLTNVYGKLIQLMPEPGRQLVLQLWRLYEVDNLKATLRGIENGASWNQVLFLLHPMARHTLLTTTVIERMIQSENIARAIQIIRHTPYYGTLDHALERYRTEQSLFPLEVALDLDYYRVLWESIQQLEGIDREWALRLLGSVIDANNLLWAIRYRVYHRLSEHEIINYTLPFGYQVRDDDIRAIAAGADIVSIVRHTYPDLQEIEPISEQNRAGLRVLELTLERRIVKTCRSAFSGYPFHIGIPLAYLLLNEHEIRDLIVVIEAKASGLPAEIFVPMLEIQPSIRQAD